VRLPKARAELDMTLHAVASVLAPGAPLWLYGANDEGIKSAAKPLSALFGPVSVVETRGHCRVLLVKRPADIGSLRPTLADWRQRVEFEIAGARAKFVTYPGLFAQGRLDAGTRILLQHLPELRPEPAVLDFGAGMGVVAAAVRARWPRVRLTLVDTDAVALAAAHENVPDAAYATGLGAVSPGSLDAILSNPPIHDGKQEDHGALETLIRRAPELLRRGGTIEIVVQRRVGAGQLIREVFGDCAVIAEDGVFQVLRAVRR
jgi:16S rRNA (guanine1207-N2)-methyltransferase